MPWDNPQPWFLAFCLLTNALIGYGCWKMACLSDELEFNRLHREAWKKHFDENVAHKWTFYDGVGS